MILGLILNERGFASRSFFKDSSNELVKTLTSIEAQNIGSKIAYIKTAEGEDKWLSEENNTTNSY